MDIEFDDNKNISNIERHGVSFEQVINFDFETAITVQDTRLHVLTFTYRNKSIRVISFRKANKREVNKYEQKK